MKNATININVKGINYADVTIEKAAELISGIKAGIKLDVKFSGFGGHYYLKEDDAFATIMLAQSLKYNRYWGLHLEGNLFSESDEPMATMMVVYNGERIENATLDQASRMAYAYKYGQELKLYVRFSSFGGHFLLEDDSAVAAIRVANEFMTGEWWWSPKKAA